MTLTILYTTTGSGTLPSSLNQPLPVVAFYITLKVTFASLPRSFACQGAAACACLVQLRLPKSEHRVTICDHNAHRSCSAVQQQIQLHCTYDTEQPPIEAGAPRVLAETCKDAAG